MKTQQATETQRHGETTSKVGRFSRTDSSLCFLSLLTVNGELQTVNFFHGA